MSKYWALIVSNRPRIFALGKHNDVDQAETMAQEFCEKRNAQIAEGYAKQLAENPEAPEPPTYDLIYILGDDDMRALTGEVHRPYILAKKREEIAVEAVPRRGSEEDDEATGRE